MKTILAAVAFAALLASPVFAQSFDPEYGSGNVLQFSQGPTASLSTKIAVHRSGLDAYAMVPRGAQSGSGYSPAAPGHDLGIESQR